MPLHTLMNDESVAYIRYSISSPDDIIDRYSPVGFELLNPDFESYISKIADYIPSKKPMVLGISGIELSKSDQNKIEEAIWNDYLLKISEAKQELRRIWMRTIWYILCSMASAILIFISNTGKFSDVVSLLLYLPLWYFLYRVLSYPIFDCIPIYKKIKQYKQLATMVIRFSLIESSELSKAECADAKAVYDKYYREIDKDTRHKRIIDKYIMSNGCVDVKVSVSCMKDIIRKSSIKGDELICDSLSGYLSRAEKFIKPNVPIRLTFTGYKFDDEEKQAVQRAVDNHKEILIKDAKSAVDSNIKEITFFAICLLISMLLLSAFGPFVNVSTHEMIIIIFWFFGDYLIEFVLLSNVDARKNLASAKTIQTAKISFDK